MLSSTYKLWITSEKNKYLLFDFFSWTFFYLEITLTALFFGEGNQFLFILEKFFSPTFKPNLEYSKISVLFACFLTVPWACQAPYISMLFSMLFFANGYYMQIECCFNCSLWHDIYWKVKTPTAKMTWFIRFYRRQPGSF